MKITSITCSACGAAYEVAEAASVQGRTGEEKCVLCGAVVARWNEPRLRAVRLVMAAEHRYARVPAPPAFEALS
jgi:hypothetical protein